MHSLNYYYTMQDLTFLRLPGKSTLDIQFKTEKATFTLFPTMPKRLKLSIPKHHLEEVKPIAFSPLSCTAPHLS